MTTRRRPFSQLVSLLVAGLSFLTVWLIAGTLTIVVPAVGGALLGQASLRAPERAAGWAVLVLACITGFYASVPVARFIARAFPVRANGNRRSGVIFACVAFGAMYVLMITSGAFLQENFMMIVPMTVLVTGTIAWTLLWQVRTTRSLDVPFILFLRRFSSFSDRSLLTALLRSRPSGYRTAFLAPPTEAAANFSPMVVAFSGTRLRRPLASCPIPLAARSVEWEDNIEDLAGAAACVVVDSSDRSPAIGREIEIVQRAVSPEKVLWLADAAVPATDGPPSTAGRAVQYQRSWRAALLRIVLETMAVGLVAVLIIGPMRADPQFAAASSWLFWVAGLGLVALAAPVIVQPSVNREARDQMKGALEAILSTAPARPKRSRLPGRRPAGVAILQPTQSRDGPFLADVVRGLGLEPRPLAALTSARALRAAVRDLHEAPLVVADVSTLDADVEYLLGVAHGLGRKVVLVSREPRASTRDAPVHRFTSGSAASAAELAQSFADAHRSPFGQGPVAALLADRWVFGDRLTDRRTIAFFLDAALSAAIAFAYLLWKDLLPAESVERGVALFQATILAFILYRFLCLALSGTTVGMALVGLRLVNADGGPVRLSQALGRSVALYAALLPFGSALAALFAPRYQVLEDALSGTRVVTR